MDFEIIMGTGKANRRWALAGNCKTIIIWLCGFYGYSFK